MWKSHRKRRARELFFGMTAAHRTLPFGTQIRVCRHDCVVVRINDRDPFVPGRHIDLTPAAARAIGLEQIGEVSMSR